MQDLNFSHGVLYYVFSIFLKELFYFIPFFKLKVIFLRQRPFFQLNEPYSNNIDLDFIWDSNGFFFSK